MRGGGPRWKTIHIQADPDQVEKRNPRWGKRNCDHHQYLPERLANGQKIADLYHGRWKIETAFQELTRFLNSEISTLGYPRAALFGFCVALVAYMILAVVKAAIEAVHGKEVIQKVSGMSTLPMKFLRLIRG